MWRVSVMAYFSESRSENQLLRLIGALAICFALVACETPAPAPPTVTPPPAITPKPEIPKPPPAGTAGRLVPAQWDDLPGWRDDDPALAWNALLTGCRILEKQEAWQKPCDAARGIGTPDREAARHFFERQFKPYQLRNSNGGTSGLITGYYEPLLKGSRAASARYRYPVYGVPDDLLVIDLTPSHPELKGMALRGRVDGSRVVPYYDRARIENGEAPVRGKEIAWVDDPIELFFLQVQGSGRIQLANGETMHVGYANHNGHPYRSIGRWLAERGELPLEQTSMQGIKAWARRNPDRLSELLHHNPRYVFFRELPSGSEGPVGAMGVPITPRRSVAVDPRFVPLGAPVYVATTWPNSQRRLNRLMLAQDTGSAIKGPVRADFFWGFGNEAGALAGRMKQDLQMWVLLPDGHPAAQ